MHSSPVKNTLTESLIKAVERKQDKALPMTKRLKSSVKHAETYNDLDGRHLGGYNKATVGQRKRAFDLINNHYYDKHWGPWYKQLQKIIMKMPKDTKSREYLKLQTMKNEILDDFIHNSGLF